MALRKGKIVEAALVQRSKGAGEKEEILGIAFRYLEIPLCPLLPCPSVILTPLTFQLNLVPFESGGRIISLISKGYLRAHPEFRRQFR